MKKKLVLIDYGVGNILSIKNAFNYLNQEVRLSSNKSEIDDATHLILPGVGSFPTAMQKLDAVNLLETVVQVSKNKKIFTWNLFRHATFFEKSYEFGETNGLKILKGEVKILDNQFKKTNIKLPNIGWRNLIINKKKQNPITKNINENDFFYFVHSFAAFDTKDLTDVINSHYYNINFPALVQKDNIFGCQFHPEKSANSGLKILQNFINLK